MRPDFFSTLVFIILIELYLSVFGFENQSKFMFSHILDLQKL